MSPPGSTSTLLDGSSLLGSKVLILGNFTQSLTAVRSLSRAGFEVIVGWDGTPGLTEYSRYAPETWRVPSIQHADEQFVESLLGFLNTRPDVGFVFPTGDSCLQCLALHAHELPSPPRLVMPDPGVVTMCLDKRAMYELVWKLGIPSPECRVALSVAELLYAASEIGYPCVVKPVDSMRPFFGRKVIVCQTPEDLGNAFRTWPERNDLLLVQRYVGGRRHNCQFAAYEGRVVAYFEHVALRTDRIDGMGVEVDGVSVEPTLSLTRSVETLVERLKYSGVGCVQFVVDDGTGEAQFMEINPRLDGTCAIAYYCGYDFPRLALECVRGIAPSRPTVYGGYPVGRRIHWLLRDLQGLLGGVRRREVGFGSLLRWVGSVVGALARTDVHVTWSWKDPLPTLAVYGGFIASALRRVRRALGWSTVTALTHPIF